MEEKNLKTIDASLVHRIRVVGEEGESANVTLENLADQIEVKKELQNIEDGSATGSLRGIGTIAEGVQDDGSTYTMGEYAFAIGSETKASGLLAVAEGLGTIADGPHSHAEGHYTRALSGSAHAEGLSTEASEQGTHTEGADTKATAYCAHAEGHGSIAKSIYSHAEGRDTVAGADTGVPEAAHAEGVETVASGEGSHAEGYGTKANSAYSHAEGVSTVASSQVQHVQGRFNVEDTEDEYAFIIGNGTGDSNRSNAFAIKWDGTFVFADGTEITPTQFASILALVRRV